MRCSKSVPTLNKLNNSFKSEKTGEIRLSFYVTVGFLWLDIYRFSFMVIVIVINAHCFTDDRSQRFIAILLLIVMLV